MVVGQTPNIERLQANLAAQMGQPGCRFRQAVAGKACLLILDDVWDVDHATAFRELGPGGCILLTTRDASLVNDLDAAEYSLDWLSDKQGLDLLAGWSGEPVEKIAKDQAAIAVMHECGMLPLAIAVCGATRRNGTAWTSIRKALEHADLGILNTKIPGCQHNTILKSLHVGVEFLRSSEPKTADRYLELAVFPEKAVIPESAVWTLWGQSNNLDDYQVDFFLASLKQKSLLRLDGEKPNRRISLHDLQRDYIRAQNSDLLGLHKCLLDGYRKKSPGRWHRGPNDGYFFQKLGYHLLEAGQSDELRGLLFDFRWLQAQLDASDSNVVIGDFESLAKDEEVKLVQGAIRLSSHTLYLNKSQLASHLTGRLLSCDGEAIARLRKQIAARSGDWLKPLTASLIPPGGSLDCTLEGHVEPVIAVAVTANGSQAVSASNSETLKVWNLRTGKVLRTLKAHAEWVHAVAVTADGSKAVSVSNENTLIVWDLRTGEVLRTLKTHAGRVNAVAVTADGSQAVSASDDKTLKVWDLRTGEDLRTLEGHTDWVRAVAVTADGSKAVSASDDKTLKVWDLRTGEDLRTLEGHTGLINAVAVTADGSRAVSASDDKTLIVWDLRTGENLRTLAGHASSVIAVAVTADGSQAVSASNDKTLKVWDLRTGKVLYPLEGHAGRVNAVAVTADGSRAVSASNDETLKVWNLRTEKALYALEGHASSVEAVAITADGSQAVSASSDKTLKVWNLRTGRVVYTLEGHAGWVNAVAVTTDDSQAISASGDKTLKVWNLRTGENLRTLVGHADSVNAVAVTTDGSRAVSASDDKTLKVWNLRTGEELRTLDVHTRAVAVTTDGRHAVSASWGCTLKVWDLRTGKDLHTLEGHTNWVNAVAVTTDGSQAVSASYDKTLKVWNLRTGKDLRTLVGHADSVNAVAVTTDGSRAVSASSDKTLKVWDLRTGEDLRTLEGHTDWVRAVALTVDGSQAVSASDDKSLKVWDLETGMVVADFRADASISACAVAADGRTFVAGDKAGQIHILRLEKGPPAGEYDESGYFLESEVRPTNTEDEQILGWFKDVTMNNYRDALQVFWCIGLIEGDAMKSAERALGWGSLSKRLRDDLDPRFKLVKLPTSIKFLSVTCVPDLDGLFDRDPFYSNAWTEEERPLPLRTVSTKKGERPQSRWTHKTWKAWQYVDRFLTLRNLLPEIKVESR